MEGAGIVFGRFSSVAARAGGAGTGLGRSGLSQRRQRGASGSERGGRNGVTGSISRDLVRRGKIEPASIDLQTDSRGRTSVPRLGRVACSLRQLRLLSVCY